MSQASGNLLDIQRTASDWLERGAKGNCNAERPIVSTPERACPVQTRISPAIFFVVVLVLVVVRRVRFRPWLIGAPHPEHFRIPVAVDGLEVSGAVRYV